MSDGLLERFVVALETIAASLATKPAPAAAATPKSQTAPATAPKSQTAPTNTASKNNAAAGNKPGTGTANRAATPPVNTPPKGAPGGKHSLDDVRKVLRQVVDKPGLGKDAAARILDEEGGVQRLPDLKPADYDKVFEAAQVELSGGDGGAAAADDDDLGV